MAASTPSCTAARTRGSFASAAQIARLDPLRSAHIGAKSASSTISATLYGAPSPIAHAWPISGRGRLQRRLDVRGRHVLAAGADDQLLLAVDDRDVAVRVDRRRRRRCAASRRRRSPRRSARAGCGSRASRQSPRISTSPSSASLSSTPGDGGADGADLAPRPAGCRCRRRTSPTSPRARPARCRSRGRTRAPRRGVGAAPTLTATSLVEAEHPAQAGEQLSVGRARDRRRQLGRAPPRPPARAAPSRSAASSAPCTRRALLLGLGARASSPGPPSASPRCAGRRRTTSGAPAAGTSTISARVRADRDRAGEDDRHVVVRVALGDVRGRQPRDDVEPRRQVDHARAGADGAQDVAMRRARRPSAGRSCPTCRSA